MSEAIVPIRSVQNPTDPNSPTAMLRFFNELRERTGGDVDLLTLIGGRVDVLRNSTGTAALSGQVREARLNARQALVESKTLRFLTY